MVHGSSRRRSLRGGVRRVSTTGARARLGAAAGALCAALSAASAEAADDGTEPIRVRVEAYAGCPSEWSFIERVRSRTLKARPATPGETARTFTVIVLQDGAVSRGRLI